MNHSSLKIGCTYVEDFFANLVTDGDEVANYLPADTALILRVEDIRVGDITSKMLHNYYLLFSNVITVQFTALERQTKL